jgi:hypothetical protein
MDWIGLVQDMDQWRALVNMKMNLWVLYSAGKILSECTAGCLLRRARLRRVSKKL